MEPEFAARILAEARRQPARPTERGRLMPHREAVLTQLAKGLSYARISSFFRGFGVTIEASAVGHFCRRHCPAAEVERVRRELIVHATGTPERVAPTALKVTTGTTRKTARIARDDL
jgi:hypothetical protein